MLLHGYFILGCIGESADEMLRIAPFAHELGLDTIALSVLRSSPHSGLDELVAGSPGYRVAPNGKIYSDECSVAQLGDLRKRIYRQFYTPGQIARVGIKGIRNDALSFLPGFLPHLPQVIAAALGHTWRKAGHRARKRRYRTTVAADDCATGQPLEPTPGVNTAARSRRNIPGDSTRRPPLRPAPQARTDK
jgi:hypothetical protein